MNKTRSRIYWTTGAFALLLLIGIVYAAATGLLHFSGTAMFNPNVKLAITDAAITDQATGESVSITPGGDTLAFTVHLTAPNETRYVTFKVANVGNEDAILGALSTVAPAASSGITVSWPTLDGVIVDTGTTMPTSDEYTIAVTWNSAYPQVTQDVTIVASIDYTQYTP